MQRPNHLKPNDHSHAATCIRPLIRSATPRNLTAVIIVAATMLMGCHSPSKRNSMSTAPVVVPPPFQPMFFTRLGTTNTTPDGLWRIGVSVTGDSLNLSRHESAKGEGWSRSGWTTDSPEGWQAKPGWFVFLESETKVWAYDGDHQLLLFTCTSDSGTWYSSPRSFPCTVPTQVFARLSAAEQKSIGKHD